MLTEKQRTLLVFIHQRLQEKGVAPSFDEMREKLNLKSKSGVHRLIGALEERQFIRRLPNRARALEVIRLPENEEKTPMLQSRPESAEAELDADSITIPRHGRIAAGTPVEALEQYENITVPAAMVGSGSHYALEIEGDSMGEAGILDGDMIIVKRCDMAENGAIVVALVDDAEATLKTLYKRGPDIMLKPANAAYETQTYPANRIRVQGRLVGLLRHYG